MQAIPDANIEIIAAESLGVRGLCCKVDLGRRCIVIDSGVGLGYLRHDLLPPPLQVAIGEQVRENILEALEQAADVVFSHFHGDHIPLAEANPYQCSMHDLPPRFHQLRGWRLSAEGLSPKMEKRFQDLKRVLGSNLQIASEQRDGALSFSRAVPHGKSGGRWPVDHYTPWIVPGHPEASVPGVVNLIPWWPGVRVASG